MNKKQGQWVENNNNMVDTHSAVSITTLNINVLNIQLKDEDHQRGSESKSQYTLSIRITFKIWRYI